MTDKPKYIEEAKTIEEILTLCFKSAYDEDTGPEFYDDLSDAIRAIKELIPKKMSNIVGEYYPVTGEHKYVAGFNDYHDAMEKIIEEEK